MSATLPPNGPLGDLRVIDLSTVIAGPSCARYLADFGADVIKVERHGVGDSLRAMAWSDPRDGDGLWWKVTNRNKRTIALDLKTDDDRALLLRLVDEAHALVENFRPGVLERLGLAPDVLLARNPRLVITRVTGFGQEGPYAQRPGFASIAEAMAGYAAIAGEPDGNPLLPPIALTDEVTGLVGAFATLAAMHAEVGQVVDVSLLESLFQIMGPLISTYLLRGEQQPRMGSGLPYTVPRGTFRCRDGHWVAISTSSDSVARRVVEMIGLGGDGRFDTFAGRVAHREELTDAMAAWVAERDRDDVITTFERAHAACGPVNTMADIAADAHFAARQAIVEVDGTPMQGLVAKLSRTPGAVRWAGRPIDADGADIRANAWGPRPGT